MDSKKVAVKEIEHNPEQYETSLHVRFLEWKRLSGTSVNEIARMISRSASAVSGYINKNYPADISALEKNIRNLLRRREDLRLKPEPEAFCNITPSRIIWEVLQFGKEQQEIVAAVGPSGTSKTTTIGEFAKRQGGTVILTIDLTRTSLGSILHMLAHKINATSWPMTNATLFDSICERLRGSNNLIVFDEAHLLQWSAIEILRDIHDSAGVGIALLGMPRLLSQMRGNRRYLWDQIASRIAMFKTIPNPTREDIELICRSRSPGLPKGCINFLYGTACGSGKLRTMIKLLNRAIHIAKLEGTSINLNLLKDIEPLFLT